MQVKRTAGWVAAALILITGAWMARAGETAVPIAAEAQTSLSSDETFADCTLIRMGYQGGDNIEIPVFRYDLGALKDAKIVNAVMTLNIEGRERVQDWMLSLRAIGGDTHIPWDAKSATLGNAQSNPGWGANGFLKMEHGPDLAEGKLPTGAGRVMVSFPFTEQGLACLRDIVEGKRPNNGFLIDLARLGRFPRVSFCSVHQRATLQPYLVVTVDEGAAATAPRFAWPGDAGALECKVTADTSICAFPDEELDNHGAKDKIRIKYVDHLWAGQFDLSPAKGKEITAGLLLLKKASGGNSDEFTMRKFGVSTIVSDFAEGKADDYGVQPFKRKDGANFRFAGTDSQFWGRPRDPKDYAVGQVAVPGKPAATVTKPVEPNFFFDPERPGPDDFTDALFGNGASRFHFASGVETNASGYYMIPIPGALLQSILIGEARGLCLCDGSGTAFNYDVWSRESKFPPKLLVQAKAPSAAAAEPVMDLRIAPVGGHAPELAFLEWTEGANTFGYEIRVDGKPIPAYRGLVGRGAGAKIRHPLDFLALGKRAVEVVPFNVARRLGAAAKAEVTMPAPTALIPLLPAPAAEASAPAAPAAAGGKPIIRLWACDEFEAVDPQTGKLFHSGNEAYKSGNSVWDGHAVRIASARNAVACFQLVMEPDAACGLKSAPDISIILSDFKSKGGEKLKVARLARYYTAWYHRTPDLPGADGKPRYLADALIQIDPQRLPAFPNERVPHQANQAFFVDIHVPSYALAGEYTAELTVSSAVSDDVVPVRLKVCDVTLPECFTFRHELNLYSDGMAEGTGIDVFDNPDAARESMIRLRQAARFHRLIVNGLPYSQSGRTVAFLTPQIGGIGKMTTVTDWSRFDRTVEPLATGKAFTPEAGYYGPLSGVPEPHMYLPLHEAWPADMSQFCANHPAKAPELTKIDVSTPEGKRAARDLFKDKLFPAYRMNCNGPEEELGAFFQDAQVAVAKQFASHFAEKGWTNTAWQCYLNNKPGFGRSSLYTLDEPITELDFRALGFFHDLWRRGARESGVGDRVRFEYRADISRSQWQFTFLDGHAINLHCVSDGFYTKNYKMRARARQFDWETWTFGGGPDAFGSALSLYGACINSWSLGADGILPYYSGMRNDFETFNILAMLYQAEESKAVALGIKAVAQTARGKSEEGAEEQFAYVGPFPSVRLLAARAAVQDIEALNALAAAVGAHRDTMRRSLRNSLDLSMRMVSTNPDDPGSAVFTALAPAQIVALRRTVLETLEAAQKRAQ
ncbi:MAG: hypothetical protein QME60_05105 [Verrucomicrobiota bacterium]|nr:hypothetical protein [Verrucomicrobiota bacterium]